MLDVKAATAKAFQYLASLYGSEANSARLEEVELTTDAQTWHVTLSYQPGSDFGVFLNKSAFPREYKVFKIDANNGEVKSMKIRKVG